jgi:hypothetical protein
MPTSLPIRDFLNDVQVVERKANVDLGNEAIGRSLSGPRARLNVPICNKN